MRILGLDISSSIVGCSVYNHDTKSIEYIRVIDLTSYDNIISKFVAVKTDLDNMFTELETLQINIDGINIEQYKLQFTRTTITTLVTLASINNFITYYVTDMFKSKLLGFDFSIKKIDDRVARKAVYGTLPKHDNLKEYVGNLAFIKFPYLQEMIQSYIYKNHPQMIVTQGATKGLIKSTFKNVFYDVTDSLTVAQYVEVPKVVKPKKTKLHISTKLKIPKQ